MFLKSVVFQTSNYVLDIRDSFVMFMFLIMIIVKGEYERNLQGYNEEMCINRMTVQE